MTGIVINVRSGSNSDAAYHGSQLIRDVISVQIQGSHPENVAFEQMISEIASYYDLQVKFENNEDKTRCV